MLDFTILFKIAGAGVLLFMLDQILEKSGKKEIASLMNIAGVIIILFMVISLISDLFNTVKTMFLF